MSGCASTGTPEILHCILHPPLQQVHFARVSANQQPVFLCLPQQPNEQLKDGGTILGREPPFRQLSDSYSLKDRVGPVT
ncbi:MAG: hypothetical protein WBN43_15245, partial [Thiogranum sp.]